MSHEDQNTYLGFAIQEKDLPFLIADIEELVRKKYAGATYSDLIDEETENARMAAHVAAKAE